MKKLLSPFLNFLLALSKTKLGRREVMRILLFDDSSCIHTLTLHGGGLTMKDVPDAQRMEVKQTLDRLLLLIDEEIKREMKGVWVARWVMLQILVRMPGVNDKMIGLSRVNDEVTVSKMEDVTDDQTVEVDQTLPQEPRVNDEGDWKDGWHS
ncbi:hypothetical protein D1007_14885 [Hordeum vulgare]|nr:hypothetical protein D1007_14885 [Hordeum vulgare]